MLNIKVNEKNYGKDIILKDIDLKVDQGEFLVVKGKSGSGKSTLINILSLLDSNYDGEYLIDGKDVKNISGSKKAGVRRENFGLIFQDYHLIESLSVIENVKFALSVVGYKGDKEEKALELLSKVGIDEQAYKKINQISGGQHQRVGIARALAINPKLIIADEPTGNLDKETAFEIIDLLKNLNEEGITIILITHDENLVKYGHRVATIENKSLTIEEVSKPKKTEIVREEKNVLSFGSLFKVAGKNYKRHLGKYVILIFILVASAAVFAGSQIFNNGTQAQIKEIEKIGQTYYFNISKKNIKGVEMEPFSFKEEKKLKAIKELKFEEYLPFPELIEIEEKLIERSIDDSRGFEDRLMDGFIDESHERAFYVEGAEPKQINEIAVSESLMKKYVDANYDNSNAKEYIGKEISVKYGFLDEKIFNDGEDWVFTKEYLKKFKKNKENFIITGIVEDRTEVSEVESGFVFLTAEKKKSMYDKYTKDNNVDLRKEVFSGTLLKEDLKEVKSKVEKMGYYFDGYPGTNDLETLELATKRIFYVTVIAMVIVATIIGLISMKTINQRNKEIGIYYALGLSQIKVFTIILFENIINLIVALFIAIIGLMGGLYVCYYVIRIFTQKAYWFNNYIELIIFMVLIVVVSVIIMMIAILRKDPIKILRKI